MVFLNKNICKKWFSGISTLSRGHTLYICDPYLFVDGGLAELDDDHLVLRTDDSLSLVGVQPVSAP